MELSLWDVLTASTPIAAWIAAFAACLALAVNWRNRADEVRRREREDAKQKPWAGLHDVKFEGVNANVLVTLHNPSDEQFTVTELRVLKPRRARIVSTYASLDGWAEHSGTTATVTVNWLVYVPGSRDRWMSGGDGRVVVALPRVSSGRAIKLSIEAKGQRLSPMREPVRMVANETITP